MQHLLLDTERIDSSPADYLQSCDDVFACFGPESQDSGNLSYGVETAGLRYFVKTTDPDADVLLDHSSRVELLRNAVKTARRNSHQALPALLNVIESPDGPMLVYEWVEGELLRAKPGVPESAHERFRRLPAEEILNALDNLYELHSLLAAAGYVAVDFYDGCLIYDFSAGKIHVVDLDHYELGAFRNSMGRMFGSSRFMAPEEFEYGERIDERTSLFSMGRTAAIFLSDGTLERSSFRGSEALHDVIVRACKADPELRYQTMEDFYADWQEAR